MDGQGGQKGLNISGKIFDILMTCTGDQELRDFSSKCCVPLTPHLKNWLFFEFLSQKALGRGRISGSYRCHFI